MPPIERADENYLHAPSAENSVARVRPGLVESALRSFVISFPLAPTQDEVAEWLRRWTANPLGSARLGSNPILVEPGSTVV